MMWTCRGGTLLKCAGVEVKDRKRDVEGEELPKLRQSLGDYKTIIEIELWNG